MTPNSVKRGSKSYKGFRVLPFSALAHSRKMFNMTLPRCELIDRENGGFHHVVSRCVRRAWLCGKDAKSKIDYSYRKRWIEERALLLSGVFTVQVYSYAAMSNHVHLALEYRPQDASKLSDEEVARRWLVAFPPRNPEHIELRVEALLEDSERLAILRERLGDLSWFMKCLNENIARRANREDDCTGRFWEGRFHSSRPMKSLDAVHACMSYVDLNPLRAGATKKVVQGNEYTSVRRRVEESKLNQEKLDEALAPMRLESEINRIYTMGPTSLSVSLRNYLEHLEWVAKCERDLSEGRKPIWLDAPKSLEDPEGFMKLVRRFRKRWGRKIGRGDRPLINQDQDRLRAKEAKASR